jgi:hypothetical protein
LAGSQIPQYEEIGLIKKALLAQSYGQWFKHIKACHQFISSIDNSPIDPLLAAEIKNAIGDFDGQKIAKCFFDHIEVIVKNLSHQLESEARAAVLALPNGENLWDRVKDQSLYGLVVDFNGDDELELCISDVDFFQHVYANVIAAPSNLRPHYAFLVDWLVGNGFGSMQDYPVFFYGEMIAVTKGELRIIKNFVDRLRNKGDEEAEIIVKRYANCKCVQKLIGEVEEVILFGECLHQLLEEDFDYALGTLEEGVELIEYAMNYQSLMDTKGLQMSDIQSLQCGDNDIADLLVAVAKQTQVIGERTLTSQDETFPFGMVVSPFELHGLSDFIDHRLQQCFEGFMNNGENNEIYIINTGIPSWKDELFARVRHTALLFGLIEAVNPLVEK